MSIENLFGGAGPQLFACHPSDRLERVVARMVENHLNALAVLEADGSLAGIVTDHDVMRAIYEGQGRLGSQLVSDWMSRQVVTCPLGTKVTDALRIMGVHKIRHLVIADGDRPVAVLGIRAILSKIHQDDELEKRVLRDLAAAAGMSQVDA